MIPEKQAQTGKFYLNSLIIPSFVLLATLIGVLFFAKVCTYLTHEDTTIPIQNIKPPQALEITASQLYKEYQSDAQAAGATYTGKTITVSGEMASWVIVNNLPIENKRLYITLFTDDSGYDFVRCDILINFRPRDYTMEGTLNPYLGLYIEVTGVCKGMLDEYVVMHNCTAKYLPPYLPE